MKIQDIDKNFKIQSKLNIPDIKYYNALDDIFTINGVYFADGRFRRMPQDIADSVNEGVSYLSRNTAGGRVRFKTNSPYVAINVKMDELGKMAHFTVAGSCGFDIYDNGIYQGTFKPDFNFTKGFESVVYFDNNDIHEVVINMPTYSSVTKLLIGISQDSYVKPPIPYKNSKPILYYGSSITQGGCCSRPGNTYQQIVSRELNLDYINLGFSGSARAENEMISYLCSIDSSCFVLDYDHNAPTVEHLDNTHEKLFNAYRSFHPDTPIIIMSRPKYHLTEEEKLRLNICKKTYENAIKSGDKNVYILTGPDMIPDEFSEMITVDNCHPNDIGFYCMAKSLINLLKKISI